MSWTWKKYELRNWKSANFLKIRGFRDLGNLAWTWAGKKIGDDYKRKKIRDGSNFFLKTYICVLCFVMTRRARQIFNVRNFHDKDAFNSYFLSV